MKRLKILSFSLAIVLILTASLAAQAYNYPSWRGVKGHNGSLDIEVWTNKEEGASFGQGENLVVYFRANRDCYVTVYDLNTEGDINLLYPYDPRDDHFIEGGRVYTIPDYYDDFVLRVNGDPGLEFIQAVASEDYFEVPRWGSNFRDPDNWRPIDRESEAIWYLQYINERYFRVENWRGFHSDLDYTYFKVRQDWQYAWDSYYYDDYDYYHSNIHFVYHPYYYRPVYYDPWWDPWEWYGVIYIDYPYGGEIWIDGIYYGIAPLFVPRVCVGWRNVRIVQHGNVYYSGRVRIRSGSTHDLYYDGKYRWKSEKRRGLDGSGDPVANKYYPKEKSISYKSSAKYTFGGKSGKSKTYTTKRESYKDGSGYKSKGSKYKYEGSADKNRKTYKTNTSKSGKTRSKDKSTYDNKSGYKSKSSSPSKTRTPGETKTKSKTDTKSKKSGSGTYEKKSGSKSDSKSYNYKSNSRELPNSRFEWKNSSRKSGSDKSSGYSGSNSYKQPNNSSSYNRKSKTKTDSRPAYNSNSRSKGGSPTKSRSSGYSTKSRSSSGTSSSGSYRSKSSGSSSHTGGSKSGSSSRSKSGGSKSKRNK